MSTSHIPHQVNETDVKSDPYDPDILVDDQDNRNIDDEINPKNRIDKDDDDVSEPVTVLAQLEIEGIQIKIEEGNKKRSTFWKWLDGFKFTEREWVCFVTLASLVTAGVSDACVGALIPYMQKYFDIGYMTVSTIFVGQCLGFIMASFSNTYLTEKWGVGLVLPFGASLQIIAYSLMAPPINFPVIVCAYVINGFGMALLDAVANAYIGGTGGNVAWKMGLLHAFYGFGALVAPLIATAFVSANIRFSYFWLVTLGIGIVNLAFIIYSFRFKSHPYQNNQLSNDNGARERDRQGGIDQMVSEEVVVEDNHKVKLKKVLTNKNVWIMSLFILVYVGAEVSIGGWIVSFVIDERNGGHSAGYVATGFWAGIAVSRLVCPRINTYVGEKTVIFYYLGLAAALEGTIWGVRSLAGNAVAVALVGFVLGPFYPNAMSVAVKVFPRSLHSGAIGFIAAFGSQGAALFPFITGVLAQKYSTVVLQPIILGLFAVMAGLWALVKVEKKTA